MAMGTERSKAMHNFTMPCDLKWGNQRFLRCVKGNSDGQVSPLHRHSNNDSDSSDQHNHSILQRRTTRDRDRDRDRERDSSFSEFLLLGSQKKGSTPPAASDGSRGFSEEEDVGIASARKKVKLDRQTAAERIKDPNFKDGLEVEVCEVSVSPNPPPIPPPPDAASVEGETSRPWSLRTRRAACKTQANGFVSGVYGGGAGAGVGGNDGCGSGKGLRLDLARPSSGPSLMKVAAVIDKLPRLRSGGNGAAQGGEKRERPKFAVSISKREIEEDFLAMAGHRPPRRPKKRAKVIQKQLDTLFPGLWLTEVTPDMYKVPELAP